MVAALTKLHLNVHELRCGITTGTHTEEGMVVLEDGTVVLLLDLRQLNVDEGLFLCRDILGNVLLDTSKHVRRDLVLKCLDLSAVVHIAKVGLEFLQTEELEWLDEVKESPKLLGVVLERSSGHQHP